MLALRYTRNLFLRCFCVVYLFAFLSFYIQIPGLYGDNGILPASSLLENSKHETLAAKVHYQPTLLWLAPYLGLNTNYALDVLALLGSFLAFTGFVSQKFCTIPMFATLWSLYFSLYQIGQTFVESNYDELLLEAGFLALLVAPFLPGKRKGSKGSPSDAISFWLVKWLLFRFFLSNGLAKLISGCPKWWALSAFDHWFETLPLPTPLSWYVHYLPKWFLKLVAVHANVSEMALPFLFFVPIRSVRLIGFVNQLFLQICIVLTGNFSFCNILLVTLLFSLLDDQFFYGRKKSLSKWNIMGKISALLIYAAVLYGVVVLYNLRLNAGVIESNINFTKGQFDDVVGKALTYAAYFGAASLCVTVIQALSNVLFDAQSGSSKSLGLVSTILYAAIALLLFFSSTVPLATLHKTSNSTVHPQVRTVYNRLHKLRAVNQYGLFPKIVESRSEIVLEGSNSIDGPWQELNFLYKPGNVNHSLPFVAPYSPRLDWQMYWAAQTTYEKQAWFLSLTHRILSGQPEVLSLLDKNHQTPFNKNPPKFVRAVLYRYKYTGWNEKSGWWTRTKVDQYLPAQSLSSASLVDYLNARNLLPSKTKQPVNIIWKNILDKIRYLTSHLEPTLLLWSVFTAGSALITTSGRK